MRCQFKIKIFKYKTFTDELTLKEVVTKFSSLTESRVSAFGTFV